MKKLAFLFAFLFAFKSYSQFNIEHSVYFDTDVYNLTKTETTRLQKFLSSNTKEEVLKIEIYGFCDDRGSNNYNLTLSQNRADDHEITSPFLLVREIIILLNDATI